MRMTRWCCSSALLRTLPSSSSPSKMKLLKVGVSQMFLSFCWRLVLCGGRRRTQSPDRFENPTLPSADDDQLGALNHLKRLCCVSGLLDSNTLWRITAEQCRAWHVTKCLRAKEINTWLDAPMQSNATWLVIGRVISFLHPCRSTAFFFLSLHLLLYIYTPTLYSFPFITWSFSKFPSPSSLTFLYHSLPFLARHLWYWLSLPSPSFLAFPPRSLAFFFFEHLFCLSSFSLFFCFAQSSSSPFIEFSLIFTDCYLRYILCLIMPIILLIHAGTLHCNTSWLTGPPLLLQTAALEVFSPGALMTLTLVLCLSGWLWKWILKFTLPSGNPWYRWWSVDLLVCAIVRQNLSVLLSPS